MDSLFLKGTQSKYGKKKEYCREREESAQLVEIPREETLRVSVSIQQQQQHLVRWLDAHMNSTEDESML